MRALLYIILGGILIIAGIVVAQAVGTYWYFRSPERVVRGAFLKLVDAKSVAYDLTVDEQAKEGASFSSVGNLDKSNLLAPVGAANFAYEASGKAFQASGEARAKDGQIFLRFADLTGLPGVKPTALSGIWAALEMQSVVAAGEAKLTTASLSSLTPEDAAALLAIVKRHVPVKLSGVATVGKLKGEDVLDFPVALDRASLVSLTIEIRTAIEGKELTPDLLQKVYDDVAALPEMTGDAFVGKKDGTLHGVVFIIHRTDGAPQHVSINLSKYNQPVTTEAPQDARSLAELLARVFGPTLTGGAKHLPFELPTLPLPGQSISIIGESGGKHGDRDTDGDGIPDGAELFYGTNPFNPDSNGDGIPDGEAIRQGLNPRGTGKLFQFGLPQ